MDQGGQLIGQSYIFQFDLVEQFLLPADPNRIGIILSYQTGGAATLVVEATGGILGTFRIAMKPAPQDREYYFSRHGPLPSCAWRALSGANNVTLIVYELRVKG